MNKDLKWSVSQKPIESRGGSNTCFIIQPFEAIIYDDWRQRDRGFSEQDVEKAARLMVEAPALLKACQTAADWLSRSVRIDDREIAEDLRKVIEKATQEEES